jgi:hypothetical protein
VSPSEAGPDSVEGGNDAERAAPPLPMYEPAGTVCLKYAYVFLWPPRPKHFNYRVIKLRFLSSRFMC